MGNNIPRRETLGAPLLSGTCGTPSHCAPITIHGAESTNNLTRARRLGPRWQRPSQSDSQRGRTAVLVEMPSPPKSLLEPPEQQHDLNARGDSAPVHDA